MNRETTKQKQEHSSIHRISSIDEINLWRMHPEEDDWYRKQNESARKNQILEENLKAIYWG